MATSLMKKLFGDTSSREIKRILPLVEKIEALEPEYTPEKLTLCGRNSNRI